MILLELYLRYKKKSLHHQKLSFDAINRISILPIFSFSQFKNLFPNDFKCQFLKYFHHNSQFSFVNHLDSQLHLQVAMKKKKKTNCSHSNHESDSFDCRAETTLFWELLSIRNQAFRRKPICIVSSSFSIFVYPFASVSIIEFNWHAVFRLIISMRKYKNPKLTHAANGIIFYLSFSFCLCLSVSLSFKPKLFHPYSVLITRWRWIYYFIWMQHLLFYFVEISAIFRSNHFNNFCLLFILYLNH